MKKKINSNWYSYERKPYDYMVKDRLLPDGRLFAQAQYPTKITAEDLPKSFVYGRFYKRWGYLNTAGIVDMIYIPNLWVNHFLKDDKLIISYTGKLRKLNTDNYGIEEYENQDFCVWGNEIIDVLKGARDYSGYKIDKYTKQLKEKLKVLKENHPDEFDDYNPNIDLWMEEPIKNYDEYIKEKTKK